MHQLLFLLQKMADNLFRKFIIRFVLNRGEELENCVGYFLFFTFFIQRASLRKNYASSFEIYSDEVPLGL